jgi:hypothetical protein
MANIGDNHNAWWLAKNFLRKSLVIRANTALVNVVKIRGSISERGR